MQDWNPQLYRQFESERTRPAQELLARIPVNEVRFATDLGCGPGNSTELLAQAWPQAHITGIDSSEAMLEQARQRLPDCDFRQADIRSWQPEQPQQVIYANASLQWLTDHDTLLPHLVNQLAPGGALAVQMPDNLQEPSHRLMREVAASSRWQAHISPQAAERKRLLSSDRYYDLLGDAGCQVDIWRTTYYHPMADAQAIISCCVPPGCVRSLPRWMRRSRLTFYTTIIRRCCPLTRRAAMDRFCWPFRVYLWWR